MRNLEKSFQQVNILGVNFSATNITETLKATLLIKSSTRTRTVTQKSSAKFYQISDLLKSPPWLENQIVLEYQESLMPRKYFQEY